MPPKKNHKFVDKMRILREKAEIIDSQMIDLIGTAHPERPVSPPPSRQRVQRSKTMPTEKRPAKIPKRQQAASLSSISKPKSPCLLKIRKEIGARSPGYSRSSTPGYECGNTQPINSPYLYPCYTAFRNSAQSIPEVANHQYWQNPWDSINQSTWSLVSSNFSSNTSFTNSLYTSTSEIVGFNYPDEPAPIQWDNHSYLHRNISTDSSVSIPQTFLPTIQINGEVETEANRLKLLNLDLDDVIDVISDLEDRQN